MLIQECNACSHVLVKASVLDLAKFALHLSKTQ